jgi:hypothetical protein
VPELAAVRGPFDRHLAKAHALTQKAAARCELAKRGPARKGLRLLRRRLRMLGKAIRSQAQGRAVPPVVIEALAADAAALADDVRALAARLSCR